MQIGLKLGGSGDAVERLHAVLRATGIDVDDQERRDRLFGPSTLEGLKRFQAMHSQPEADEIVAETLDIMVTIEETLIISLGSDAPRQPPEPPSEPPSSTPPPTGPKDDGQGVVFGKLVDGDGLPLAGRTIAVGSQQLDGLHPLQKTQTDAQGTYRAVYPRPRPLSLLVQALGKKNAVIAQADIVFAAPAEVEIDLTTAKDGIVRPPSDYVALKAEIAVHLGGRPLQGLKENAETHDLHFLARASGAGFARVAGLYIAGALAAASELDEATLFGLSSQGVPATLPAALAELPDAGLDETFLARVMAGVLAPSRAILDQALSAALAGGVLPMAYAETKDAELDRLDALRIRAVGARPYVRGKTPLSDLLAAGAVHEAAAGAFVEAYAASGGRLGPTWKALRANKDLTKPQLETLKTTLSVGELLAGNLQLVGDILTQLQGGSLASVPHLAMLDQADWEARIHKLDPRAASIPAVLPDETADQRITRFAKAVAGRLASRYPTRAFVGRLQKADAAPFEARAELVATLSAHPRLSLKRSNIDLYLQKNEVKLSKAALEELKTAQRLHRLSPHYDSVVALKSAGYGSAQSVYFKGREPFVAEMTEALGSAAKAKIAWVRAQATYATVLTVYANYNLAINAVTPVAMASPAPAANTANTVANLPTLQALFGSLDYCQCADCRSVYSQGAYLVDLLQFLKQRPATGGFANARDVLLSRRPDLAITALGCDNAEVTLPQIDLVNELLEAAVAPPAQPAVVLNTTGTSAERRALSQTVSLAAYALTGAAVFPLGLPFDLNFARTEAYLAALGRPLADCMALSGASAAARAAARLGLNPAMRAVINDTDAHQPWQRWGFATANPANVVDPKTRQTFAPADWVAALSRVPVLLVRSGLSLQQLHQLLEVRWVARGAVTLQPGTEVDQGVQVVSCDTETMTFTGLDAPVLGRANRFLRLWSASGLDMWELDWALPQAASLNDAFLVFLADAIALSRRLTIPFQQILGFWGALETVDVTNHLGESDVVEPSTYTRVFRSPTILASWAAVFTPAAALAGTSIVPAAGQAPSAAQIANLGALKAALGLSADDVSAILTATGAANSLSTPTLGVLLRHARLASSLSLTIPDLLLWITLTDGRPFAGSPADTVEFLRRLDLLQATAIPLHDLDYLLRNGSAPQSPLTFTTAQSTSALQAIRDALAKLTPAQQGDAAIVRTIVVNTLTTATGVSANVVSPVLTRSGALPLSQATVGALLAQTAGVNPQQVPQLVTAIAQVAKAAALFGALQCGEAEFAFLTQNVASFGWLDPASLPLAPPAASPYLPFERLLQALQLNARQRARTPKLFDVLAGWVAALPVDVASAISGGGGALAQSLNASVADVTELATALAVTAPALTVAGRLGSLADMARLSDIAAGLDLLARYRISAATLLQMAASPPTANSATAAMGVFQAQYDERAWLLAVQPVEDTLRHARRDALVAYILGQGPAAPVSPPMLTSEDIFMHLLIDPEMCACGITTRLLQASLAVQLFVRLCSANIVPQVKIDATVDPGWSEWTWMQEFRLWQANRQVFLYPENYLRPELRTDKSAIFADLENELRQGNCDDEAVTTAFETYLRKLVEMSQLVVAAHYQETKPDGSRTLHVFARTRGAPAKWYYRTRSEGAFGAGIWNAWRPLNLDIHSEHLMPVVWDQRLHLVWPNFKQISQAQSSQAVPSGGGGSSPAPEKYWAVEFAMSELSAGQWQAKRTIQEKMFFHVLRGGESPSAFKFRAYQDANYNLRIEAYHHAAFYQIAGGQFLMSEGVLPTPEAPMAVSEFEQISGMLIDTSQEPTYTLAKQLPLPPFPALPPESVSPAAYGYSGQDLVYGGYTASNPGVVPLNVLSASANKSPPASLELLHQIENPRLTAPQQEAVFDAADPFFVADPSRAYFVQPHYYTVSSSPTEIDNLAYTPQWTTRFAFANFYHPFARTFLRELEIGGVDRLMQRRLQLDPLTVRGGPSFDFDSAYKPQIPVVRPLPVEDVDFEIDGAYALYNWELFYHAPMLVASQLLRNQQFDAALKWLGYIFDPTDPNPAPTPGHYWRMRKFYEMNADDWVSNQIQKLLTTLAVGAQTGVSDAATAAAIQDWLLHPFDPHRIARLRIGAYAKATVMKYLDVLIAAGDYYFSRYTMENVARAEQYFIFAKLLLGPQPDQVRLPEADQPQDPDATTYTAIESQLDQFSNALVEVENLVSPPATATPGSTSGGMPAPLPHLGAATTETLFFCIPGNRQLLDYWNTVDDRLYKIRHCLNQQGVPQPVPLYPPPIDPMGLVAQVAGGGATLGAPAFTPIYRFTPHLERAIELANDVRAYGALVLAALEKKDAEALAALHASQDADIQTRMLDLKTLAVAEAVEQMDALIKQKAAVQVRRDFYASRAFMNDWETVAIALQAAAMIANGVAVVLDMTSGGVRLIPSFTFGAAGFGGSPLVTTTLGGEQAGAAASSWASVARGLAGILGEAGAMASTVGGYQRRADDWKMQADAGAAEMLQIDAQIKAHTERQAIALNEVEIQTRQISNATAISDFLTSKYTNADLYDWMLSQLTTVHTQAYQLAFGLAQQAQTAFQYELGSQESFVQFGYWDSQHKGLTAGESLMFDLRRMQAQYLVENAREEELTMDISLALTQPTALVQLLQTGSCTIYLDEALYDRRHPGQYFRRHRYVAMTFPYVGGSYTGVHATLTLNSAIVRVTPPVAPYTPASMKAPPAGAAFVASPPPAKATISTSHGQNDGGLFEVNMRDDRWLPFEGQGAVCAMTLTLDPRDNSFDIAKLSDVVLHLRYTARTKGGNAEAVRQALKPPTERRIMLSVRNTFGDAYYEFFNPADPAAAQQRLLLPLSANELPFSNLGAPKITALSVYLSLTKPPPANTTIAASLGPTAAAVAISLAQPAGATGAGAKVSALGADAALAGPTAPGTFTLTIAEGSLPAALIVTRAGHKRLDPALVEDIVLVVTYTLS